MKVYKFYCGQLIYAVSAKTKEKAIKFFEEETGDEFTVCEEIPESEWDKKIINIWVDNDFNKKPYKTSIRELMISDGEQMIYSNDVSSF